MSSELANTIYGMLPANLQSASLGDLCEKGGVQTGPFGTQLHKEDYVNTGTPIITVEHLGENRIVHENLPLVSDVDKKRLSKYSLKTGDIVFSRVGSVDRRALVQPEENGWLFSGRCLRVRPNQALLDSRWLSYFFGLPAFKSYIRGIAVGATMPSLNTKILSDVPVYYPPIAVQRVSAKLFVILDDRIALLRETNATLEAIAQALFKSWFVDFDPVQAKQEGREPECMDADTAALFPDSFEESELGLVPKGWRVGKVEDLLVLAYGKALKASERLSGTIPVYGSGGITGCHNEPLVNGPSIVVGRKGTVGSLYWIDQPFYPIDTVFYVKANVPLSYCYYQLALLGLEGMNTDAAVPGLNRNNVYRLSVVIPFNSVIEKFDSFVTLLRRRIFSNVVQSQTLASIRDTLLPRLISGQLRLPEVEAIIEEATA